MALVSIPAVYDGKQIRLLESVPVHEPYRVLVTFVEPESRLKSVPQDLARFWASFGAWRDDRPIESALQDIHRARRSKAEPPSL